MPPSSSSHSFACHRCRQPLYLPASLSDDAGSGGALTQSAYDVIEAEHAQVGRSHQPAHSTARSPDSNGKDDLVAPDQHARDAAPTTHNSLSSHLALTTSLFGMLSSTVPPESWSAPEKSPLSSTPASRKANLAERREAARLPLGRDNALVAAIDHPLCAECTNVLLSIMDAQLDELRRERDAYTAFEDEMRRREAAGEGGDEGDLALQADIDRLVAEAEEAKEELLNAQRDAEAAEDEMQALEEQEKALQEEEKRFWQEYSSLSQQAARLSSQRSSLQASLAHDRAQLNRLELTNVYNDAFAIGYDGGYATINGLRLGRMPSESRGIEWTEINAAWGQTAFLLITLARKVGLEFQDYAIHPMGSFSTVEKVGNGERREVYELHGSGDWQLGRLLTDRRFDHAMVAFLECLRQLCAHVTARDPHVKLPHTIHRDKIGGASIRLQFGSDEIWTRALRNVLMTLKIILTWAINNTSPEEEAHGQDGTDVEIRS